MHDHAIGSLFDFMADRREDKPVTEKIRIERLTKQYEVRDKKQKQTVTIFTALEGIDLSIREGEFITIVGPSGCGKSTLLDLLAGLTAPTKGRILIDGREVNGPGLNRGIVFQQYALLPWKTARGNIEFGLEAKGIPRSQWKDLTDHYLELVGLQQFGDRYPHELSGGMKQRVAIARSLAYNPDVLLMDEPFAALDAQTRESLQTELLRIWKKTKKTIIFITHGIDEAVYLGERIVVLTPSPGRVKKVIPVSLNNKLENGDVKSSPEFARIRHEVWSLFHEHEFQGAYI